MGKTSRLRETSRSGGLPTSCLGGFACSGGRQKYFLFARQPWDLARVQTPLIFCTTACRCQIKKSLQTKFLDAENRLSTRLHSTANQENLPFGRLTSRLGGNLPFGRFRFFGRSTSRLGGFAPSGCRRQATLRLVNAGTSDFLKVQVTW